MNQRRRMNKSGGKSLLAAMLIGMICAPAFSQDDEHAGKEVYDLWCGICHEPGEGFAGTQMLTLTRAEGLSVIKDNDTLVGPYIELVVRKGLGMMPVFRKTEITDEQLAALIEYLGSDE